MDPVKRILGTGYIYEGELLKVKINGKVFPTRVNTVVSRCYLGPERRMFGHLRNYATEVRKRGDENYAVVYLNNNNKYGYLIPFNKITETRRGIYETAICGAYP